MPGNTIKINDSNELEWYVGDSRIDELMLWLDENGQKIQREKEESSRKVEQLILWVSDLIFPGKVEDYIHILKNYKDESEEIFEFYIYTDEHRYRIYAVDRTTDAGYLGCQALARKIRAGEDWSRGNDLPDGPFIKATWVNIIERIVNYELVQLSKFKKPNTLPIDN